jgi:glycosyltransferase involved in cell wall biosynthesis
MIDSRKVVVIMPAYNAEKPLEQTIAEIPRDIVDEIILVDDASTDNTFLMAEKMNLAVVLQHDINKGYGANQKTCYDTALGLGADIVIMLHPDYQYTPKLLPSMAYMISSGLYPVVIASRILGRGALKGNMPLYKYIFNRLLTLTQNILMNEKLSEYHSGYRAFSRKALESVNYHENSDDFVFDNQMLSQLLYAGFQIGEITCPTKYFPEASSINFRRSIKYGLGVLQTSMMHCLQKMGIGNFKIYKKTDEGYEIKN